MPDQKSLTSSWMRVAHDIGQSLRTLRRAPVFTAVALLTLTIGVGVNTAIFSLVNALVLRDLPVRNPARRAIAEDGDERASSRVALVEIATRGYGNAHRLEIAGGGVAGLDVDLAPGRNRWTATIRLMRAKNRRARRGRECPAALAARQRDCGRRVNSQMCSPGNGDDPWYALTFASSGAVSH